MSRRLCPYVNSAQAAVVFVSLALVACSSAGMESPGEHCFTVDGRAGCLVVPSAYRRGGTFPLVIYLHGNGGEGREDFFSLAALAEANGFLYAYPGGALDETGRRSWNATDACCFRPGPGGDDVAYLDHVLDSLEAKYRVDRKRVFVTGQSLGGFMAQRFACDRAGRVAAVVSHAGALWKDRSRCRPAKPVSVLLLHGDADTNVRYQGGGASRTGNPYPSAHETFEAWAVLDGCSGPVARSVARLDLDRAEGAETRVV